MNKKLLLLIILMVISSPLIIYILGFYDSTLSNNNNDWEKFGNYLNGSFSPLIALVGILVTYNLGIISEKRNKTNLEIEKLKNRPILDIRYFDAENHMRIFIENKGNGALIIKSYSLINILNGEINNNLFDCLPKLEDNDYYNNYTGNINGIVLKENESFELFLYEKTDDTSSSRRNRNLIRNQLKKFNIRIEYEDIYGDRMPIGERSLEWFGRNLN